MSKAACLSAQQPGPPGSHQSRMGQTESLPALDPPICSMRFLQESAGMGWIICRASVSVVGLSVRAGHSSGVVPFPGVEDDSLQEREESEGCLFLSNDTPWLDRKRRLSSAQAAAGWGYCPKCFQSKGLTVAATCPDRASPTNPFCHHPRARRGDSLPHQSAQTFMFFELPGRRRKVGVPWPLHRTEGCLNGSCQPAATLFP